MSTHENGQFNMLVSYDVLKEITGYRNQSEVIACLIRQDIKFHTGKRGKPWTTLAAIELAMTATFNQHESKDNNPVITF